MSKLEKESTDAFKLLANEFNELYLTTLISFYIAIHYAQDKKHTEALTLARHALGEIQNCCDFAQKSFSSSKGHPTEAEIKNRVSHLDKQVRQAIEKLQIKAFSRSLVEQEKAKEQMLSKFEDVQIDTTAETKTITANSLYEQLFDSYGQVKTNIGKKVVVRSGCLELLETSGKALAFESLSVAKETASFGDLKFNKSLKLVSTVPHFQSVPATAHLFDIAGTGIVYPQAEQGKDDGKGGRWFGSIGSFFGRK